MTFVLSLAADDKKVTDLFGKSKAPGSQFPGDGVEKGDKIEVVDGKLGKSRNGERIIFQNDDEEAIADLRNGRLTAHEAGAWLAKLKKIERKNPVVEKR
tara:strand:+ start:12866 stop:13162 length:297 start_codon:yes stop_codon:yes gene_type:complete